MHVDRPGHRRRHSAGVRCCVTLLLLVIAACSTIPRGEGTGAEEETTVRVENHAWMDMTIYAIADGQRVRLGSVTGSTTAVLRIPSRVVGLGRNVSFVADPLGSSRTSTSFEIYVRPGAEITLTIPAQAG
jgi:hypothetical protein